MRQLKWDVPFADRSPLDLMLLPIKLDAYGWWVDVEAMRDRPGKWRLHFTGVLGFKYSNESYFDWTKWAGRLEATHQASAYIVEDGDWRDEFWNGRSGQVFQSTHFVIATGDCLLECLAGQFDLFPSDFVPGENLYVRPRGQ
jgi:hypothetical protein